MIVFRGSHNIMNSQVNQWITFVRSFTGNEDSLIMWNSSYANNGMGVSLGIIKSKINKQSGIDKYNINKKDIQIEQQNNDNYIPLKKFGLYEVCYIDKNGNDCINNILECLKQFKQKDFSDSLKGFLSEIILPIAHLIKDVNYSHEREFRLIYIGSIENDHKYINITGTNGIYLDTEDILFDGKSKEKICFGPKLDDLTFLKFSHIIKYKNYDVEIKKSDVKYR